MALTESEKEELLRHFSIESFNRALYAFIDGERDALYARMRATPKPGFDEEAMDLILTKGGIRTIESLMEKFKQLKDVATE